MQAFFNIITSSVYSSATMLNLGQ
ncbi:hypothetical protein PHAMO_50005 [Magnetospirillum molischianum DSM 120]|uniref:Uncharacterized protein n=1 Tax=Magnetospirillum molischianum DSM 120 TaxID=1150626 RepID=H8FWX2_MAGML|nr:hypothetical protein PHAMO_50005 [Magnetospirillum molischianum DSM 120]